MCVILARLIVDAIVLILLFLALIP